MAFKLLNPVLLFFEPLSDFNELSVLHLEGSVNVLLDDSVHVIHVLFDSFHLQLVFVSLLSDNDVELGHFP